MSQPQEVSVPDLLSPPIEAIEASKALAGGIGPGPAHYKLARDALVTCRGYDPHAPFQEAALAREAWIYLTRLLGQVWAGSLHSANDIGMLPADHFAAAFLESTGANGARLAEVVRNKGRVRWQAQNSDIQQDAYLWRIWHRLDLPSTTMGVASALTVALWKDRLKAKFEVQPCPAITAGVLELAMRTLWQGPGNTVWCHRVFRWVVNMAFAQSVTAEPSSTIHVVGGFAGLAQLLGDGSRSAAIAAGKAVAFLQTTQTAPGDKPWLRYEMRAAAPDRPAVLSITPHEALLPQYVLSLAKQSRAHREARRLVPIPQDLPLLVGRRNKHASLCTLQLLMLAEFRARAKAYTAAGSIQIAQHRWAEMMKAAGLSRASTHEVVHAWCCPDGQICRIGDELYALAAGLRTAIQLLIQAAEHERRGLSVQKRSRRRFRKSPTRRS